MTRFPRFLSVVAAGSALALSSVAAPTAAEARCWGCGVAAGVIGGIAVGAIIAGALSPPAYGYYGYGPIYGRDPAYSYGSPVYYGGYRYGSGYRYGGTAYDYGYGYPAYGGATTDYSNRDRMMQGAR